MDYGGVYCVGRSLRKKRVVKEGLEGRDNEEGWKRIPIERSIVKKGMCGWRNRGRETEGGQKRLWEGLEER